MKATDLFGRFFVAFCSWLSFYDFKSVNLALAHCIKNAMTQTLILLFKLHKELFHFLTLGGMVLGTQTGYDRQTSAIDKILYILFGGIEQWTNQPKLSVGKI